MPKSAFTLAVAVVWATALGPVGLGRGAVAPRADHRPPSTPSVDGNPETRDLKPSFHFSAKDDRTPPAQLRFRCAIDTAMLQPCSSVTRALAPLSFGRHLLRVRAVDRAGNASKVAVYAFTIIGSWNAGQEFAKAPDQANPARDTYGNTTWFYLYSGTTRHDPSDYHVLPYFAPIGSDVQMWHSTPDVLGYPGVWLGGSFGQITISPGNYNIGQNAVLGWRSPFTGTVLVDATIFVNQTSCPSPHNGILWSIDQDAATLQSGHLELGATATIKNLSTSVTTGEALYLVIDADRNSNCDASFVDFIVQTG